MLESSITGPRRVLPARQDWKLFDASASRSIEARELARHAPGELMREAARSVARLALALAPYARRVLVAVGPGGNGGDGLHAAAELTTRGLDVVAALYCDPTQLSAEGVAALDRARAAGVLVVDKWPDDAFDLVIDALLGIGASRAPQGRLAEYVSRLNTAAAPRLAVDLPSGLCADTGALLGADAVSATATLALLTLKPGLFTAAGRDHAGEVWFDDLGADLSLAPAHSAALSSEVDHALTTPQRRHSQHKGSFGDVVVIGGDAGMTGAARLAAHAALACGAGRTIVSLLDRTAMSGDVTRPEWLWQHTAWLPGHANLETSTVVCGCGGGVAVRAALPAVLARAGRLVLDADALNAVAADPGLARQLSARAARGCATVLTPHPLEAARLLGCSTPDVQQDRLAAAGRLTDQTGAVVVLKGSGTVISAQGLTPVVNSTGNAALATGGTGDVLAGWIAGLWAQQGDGRSLPTAFNCSVASVWRHGAAADAEGPYAMRARDLIEAMRALPLTL